LVGQVRLIEYLLRLLQADPVLPPDLQALLSGVISLNPRFCPPWRLQLFSWPQTDSASHERLWALIQGGSANDDQALGLEGVFKQLRLSPHRRICS
jgi:hypothetical protein